MEDVPKIRLVDFFEEVMQHHLDGSIKKSLDEFMNSEELQNKLEEVIKSSKEATTLVLSISARSGVSPPIISTNLHIGIIIGVGLALELLNEREGIPH